MDHFPLFNSYLKALVDDIEVSSYVTYDNQGYHDFPLRANFEEKELQEGLFLGQIAWLKHRPDEYMSLIQAWFYWALLHECLQESVDPHDFIGVNSVGATTLRTVNLEGKLVDWATRLQSMSKDTAQQHIRNANDVLGRTSFLLTVLSQRRDRPWKTPGGPANVQYWERNGANILPRDLELAICALGYALDHAINVVSTELGFDSLDENNGRQATYWYTPAMLTNLLKLYKFCESDMIHFDNSSYGFISSCMAVGLSDLSRRGDHSACTASNCAADNIKPEAYTRAHIQEDCFCASELGDRAWQEMLSIIEHDGIPLIRVKMLSVGSEVQEEPQIEVLAASQNVDYVAFSHVWADGRGNQTGNDMYRCQWQWLQKCAQLCIQEKHGGCSTIDDSFPFWIDTVCVPRGDGQRILDLRYKSITMMSQIYRSAKHVIVLDAALERLHQVSVLEFATRLKFCSWSRRVWTLHEGAVAKDVKIRTAGGLLSVVQLMNQMATAKYPARDENGWRILSSIELEYIHAMLPTCIMFHNFARSEASMFTFSWHELAKRTTSVEIDRYLVFGIMNQLPPQTLQALQRQKLDETDPEAAARRKLKILMKELKIIPQSVIFTVDRRFDEPGMRWAPGALGAEIPEERPTRYLNTFVDNGVIVKYYGWRLLSSLHAVRQSVFVRLEIPASDNSTTQAFHIGVWPTDAARASISSVCDLISANTPLAIILEQIPTESSTYTEFRRGLLVQDCGLTSVTKSEHGPDATAILTNYIAVLRVMSVSDDRQANETIQASWAAGGEEQLWCVG